MYSTCLFCHADLGANEGVESFPVGRRLAYDADRGRLWVVCRACERWNLSPMEERWEAIEEMERTYRDTRLRVSTENIGLARLREGTELIRIGAPQRPEMAAWRYGDQFGRRRKRAIVTSGLGVAALGAVVLGGAAAGASLGGFYWMFGKAFERAVYGSPDKVVARITTPGGAPMEVKRKHLEKIRLVPAGSQWWLEVRREHGTFQYRGEEAVRVAARLLPAANRFGGNRRQVSDAVGMLERSGSVSAVFSDAALQARAGLPKLPAAVRLALEMAAHEEAERRALEGELAVLEQAWREAEEIAAISDRLLVPDSLQRALDRLRA